jgi:hypothetical protein
MNKIQKIAYKEALELLQGQRLEDILLMAARYQMVSKLNCEQFKTIHDGAVKGVYTFDDIVDEYAYAEQRKLL